MYHVLGQGFDRYERINQTGSNIEAKGMLEEMKKDEKIHKIQVWRTGEDPLEVWVRQVSGNWKKN